jgi:hypothetical protein
MKSVLTTLVVWVAVATSGFLGLSAYYWTVQARQTHLEQQCQEWKYRFRKLEIAAEAVYNENLQLHIQLERITKAETDPAPAPVTIEKQDKVA